MRRGHELAALCLIRPDPTQSILRPTFLELVHSMDEADVIRQENSDSGTRTAPFRVRGTPFNHRALYSWIGCVRHRACSKNQIVKAFVRARNPGRRTTEVDESVYPSSTPFF